MPRKTIKSLEAQIETLRGLHEDYTVQLRNLEARIYTANQERRQWEEKALKAEKDAAWLKQLVQHLVERKS